MVVSHGDIVAACVSHRTFNINGIFMTACCVNAFSHSHVRTAFFRFHAGFLSSSFLRKVVYRLNCTVNGICIGSTDVA